MELRSLEVIFQEAEKVQREGNNTKMSRAYDGDPQDRCNAVVKRTLNSKFFRSTSITPTPIPTPTMA